MRRVIVLALLFLLPLEVLVGVFLAPVTDSEAPTEIRWMLGTTPSVLQESPPDRATSVAAADTLEVPFDLGESSELVDRRLEKSSSPVTSPPVYIALAVPLMALPVPVPPAI